MKITVKTNKKVYEQLLEWIKKGSDEEISVTPTEITFYTDETEN